MTKSRAHLAIAATLSAAAVAVQIGAAQAAPAGSSQRHERFASVTPADPLLRSRSDAAQQAAQVPGATALLLEALRWRGHTAKQLEAALADKLRQGYLRDPDVSVEIDRYRPIFVMGEVGAAGQYSYVPGLTVQKAIAIAGGFSARANQESVDITRDINGKVITGRVLTSDPLMPGDTVYVRERLF